MNAKQISIFLSCPNDCIREKAIVAKEISKLALIIKDAYNIDLQVLTFENNTFSAIGEDGQNVVNSQIGDSYDVYVGLVRARLGTPTKRAASGTVEEYELALTRNRREGKPCMLFFEIDFEIKKSEADLSELQRVKDFIKRVREDGMLTRSVTAHDIDVVVYTHLYKALNSTGLINKVETVKPSDEEIKIITEELRILTENANSAQENMRENLLRQMEVIGRFDGKDSWRTRWMHLGEDFVILRPKSDQEIHQASTELNAITSEMKGLIADFRPRYKAYIEASIKMFSHRSLKQGLSGIERFFEWANKLQALMAGSSDHLMHLTQMYGNLRNLSPEFVDAKLRLVALFREMASDYMTARELLWIVVKTAIDTTGQHPARKEESRDSANHQPVK